MDELNEIHVYCVQCDKDITMEAQYSTTDGWVCRDCNCEEEEE